MILGLFPILKKQKHDDVWMLIKVWFYESFSIIIGKLTAEDDIV